MTPHVAQSAANWLETTAGGQAREGSEERVEEKSRKLQSQSSLRVRQREFGLGPQLPVPLAMPLVSFHNAEDQRDREHGSLLLSVLPKAGKANYLSRLAARACACALTPVAILPLLRHRKQTQVLVSLSLGEGAF